MASSVRISLRVARAIAEVLESNGMAAAGELEAAIAKAERSSAVRRTLAKPKVAKRKAKRQRTKDVRVLVVERARGKCEACGDPFGVARPELDHFFSKARAESVQTCWLVCGFPCHHRKTRNDPSASFWLVRFARHCRAHGYEDAALRAEKRLAWIEARGAL